MLYRILLFSVKPQHESAQVYIYPLPFETPYHLPPHSTPLGWYRAPIPIGFYFTDGNVSFHITLSIHLTLSSLLSMSISLFSMSVSPLLPYKLILQYHFSRFHMCVRIQYLSFSFWLHSLSVIGFRFIHLISTDSNVFIFMAE